MTTSQGVMEQIEAQLGALSKERTGASLDGGWRALLTMRILLLAGNADLEDPFRDAIGQFVAALEPDGWSADETRAAIHSGQFLHDADGKVLDAAADLVEDYLLEFDEGEAGEDEDEDDRRNRIAPVRDLIEGVDKFEGGYLAVDAVAGKVIWSAGPIVTAWGRPIVRGAPKVGRNDPCPCGSGKKYKKCRLSPAYGQFCGMAKEEA